MPESFKRGTDRRSFYGAGFGLPVSDIQKVVKSNQEAPVMKAIIIGLMEGIGEIEIRDLQRCKE